MAIYTLQYIKESQDKSNLDSNFKSKKNKNFRFLDIQKDFSLVKKYLKQEAEIIKNKFIGEIAICNDDFAGYILINPKNHFISPIHVYEKFRGYGLGNILTKHGIEKYGARKLWVYSDNQIAMKMYKSFGFKEIYKKKCNDENIKIYMSLGD